LNSFQALNDLFAKDKNNVYSVGCSTWDACYLYTNKNFDPATFESIGKSHVKDKNGIYYTQLMCPANQCFQEIKKIANADPDTFEEFSEDANYALDKNNMYSGSEIINNQGLAITDRGLFNSLKGKIILKVDDNGEAYYVSPNKKEMYFLSRPVIAFQVMREQGVGITNANLEKIPVGANCPSYNQNCDIQSSNNSKFASSQKGKILLQVEGSGEAWYVNPNDSKRYFLGRPTDAFNIMKILGLGISNANFDRLIK
jgi:hypothetical protein